MTPTPDPDRWRNMDGTEPPPVGVECELLLPGGDVISGAVYDPEIRTWRFEIPQHLRNSTLYLSGWRPAKQG